MPRPLEQAAQELAIQPDQLERRLSDSRAKLFAQREKRIKPSRDEKIITAWNGQMLAALLVFAFTGHIGLAMAAWVIVCGLQDLAEPIMEAWLNQNIPSKVRATVISMSGQTGDIGALGSSTGLGAFGDQFGVRSTLKLLGVILLPVILLYRQNVRALPIGAFDAGAGTQEPG